MKKTAKFLGFIALACFAFSCTREYNPISEELVPAEENTSEQQTAPLDLSNLDPAKYLVSFGASINDVTKANINTSSGEVSFLNEDKVLVVSDQKTGSYQYNTEGDYAGKFTPVTEADAVENSTDIKVYYPENSYTISEGTVTFTMPTETIENPGTLAPMCGVVSEGIAVFKNLGAILMLTMTGAEPVTAIELVADKPITGSAPLSWSDAGVPSVNELSGGSIVKHNFEPEIAANTETTLSFFLPAPVELGTLEIRAIYGKKVGDTTFEPYKKISRTGGLTTEKNKIIAISHNFKGFFSGGDGLSEATAYEIANADDFKKISTLANATAVVGGNGYNATAGRTFFGSKGVYYKQTENIAFGTESMPGNISDYLIAGVVDGSTAIAFSGTYNGNNHSLSNFTVNKTPADDKLEGIALFKRVENAKLLNIAISNAVLIGGKFTAGLAGYATGDDLNIEGCSISNSELESNTDYGVGGLIGGIYGGTVKACSAANLKITDLTTSKNYFGGLICYINGTVTVSDCTLESGTIEFKGASICGGIVAQSNNDNAAIKNCVNNSTIKSNLNYVGGIVGYLKAGTLDSCGNTGPINGAVAVGGLVGNMGENGTNVPKTYGVITNKCYNTGNISGTGNNVGGLAGVVTAGRIEKSRNTGVITSTGSNVGGIAGQVKVGDVNACYSGHDNNIEGASVVGGIVGLLYPIEYSSGNRWFGGTKVINCQSSSYIISTDTSSNGAAGCIVGWARQVSGHWGIVIANCTNWGSAGRVKSTNTGSDNLNLGGIVGRLEGGNWAIVDNCFSYTTLNAIQINGANLDAGTAAGTAPFVNVGPVYGYKTGTYATIRDCFYRSGWNNTSYLGKDASTGAKKENVVQIQVSDAVGKGTATQAFNLYSGQTSTYSAGTLTLLNALNRSAHNINDANTFKNYQTNVNSSNIAYEGWAQPKSGGWLVPAALKALGTGFYKN